MLPGSSGDLVNRAEITGFDNTAGQTQPAIQDIDSTPDTDVSNDVEIDDVIDNSGGDQDDEDLASVRIVRYDLALRKTTTSDVVSPGEKVPFTVTVFNQGLDAEAVARNIVVTDTLPPGLAFNAADNPDWTDLGGGKIQRTVPGPVAPGDSVGLGLILTVEANAPDGPLKNLAEISTFQDTTGTFTPTDVDSTPDANPGNDVEVDDVIDNTGGDEDDADPAQVRLIRYDLALRKTTPSTQVKVGDLVPFTITVFNQAANPAASTSDIVLVDEIPAGFAFSATDNPGWTVAGGRQVTTTIAGPLAPGATTAVTLKLRVAAGATNATLANLAEIARFAATVDGQPRPDVDSTPDTNVKNDKLIDDVIDNTGGDEDDHDIARVTLKTDAAAPAPAQADVAGDLQDAGLQDAARGVRGVLDGQGAQHGQGHGRQRRGLRHPAGAAHLRLRLGEGRLPQEPALLQAREHPRQGLADVSRCGR